MRVAVLGAGLQGSCVAMELAARGVEVDLYDQNARCMTRASGQNEGKIHLGYVYANDSSRQTARAMISGAVRFAPLLRKHLGADFNALPVSTPFYYVVHRQSLLEPDSVEKHFAQSQALAAELGNGAAPDYFGRDYHRLPARLTAAESAELFDERKISAAYRTEEVSIDPQAMAELVQTRITSEPRIHCRWNTQIQAVTPSALGVTVHSDAGDENYDHVVNTLWHGRLAIDQSAGILPDRPWLYRVKYYLRLHVPGVEIPSTTIVLGAFGDVVNYGDGHFYLSWYPSGMLGSSSAIQPPDWSEPLSSELQSNLRTAIVRELSQIVIGVRDLPPSAIESAQVKGGVIFAWGETDINDRESELHQRHSIGPRSFGNYHSIDTGKLTMAPLFAEQLAGKICP